MEPIAGPLDATVRPPGSKSLTNRALVCAALSPGRSVLEGVLHADDTEAMAAALRQLGVAVEAGPDEDRLTVTGPPARLRLRGGRGDRPLSPPGGAIGEQATEGRVGDRGPGRPRTAVAGPGAKAGDGTVELDARLSGTTARFLLPVLALGAGRYRLDGAPPLRARPMADGIAAVRSLGVEVVEEGIPGHLPVVVHGRAHEAGPSGEGEPGRPGGAAGVGPAAVGEQGDTGEVPGVRVAGDASSQFLSGLLLTGPAWPGGLRLVTPGKLVSRPYVEMTAAVMRAFGARVEPAGDGWLVRPGGYRPAHYRIEPDASSASYFFAAAAICGGRVTVEGLGPDTLQGDVGFVDVLERMGCRVSRTADATTVESTGPLGGVDVDMGEISDTAQTLAVVAVFARTPTRVRGIGFIRAKETDRVGRVVHELRRCGIVADEEPDGFVVHPGTPRPARVETHDDHRMAMSFALLGLRAPGIEIADPACVAKTFPGFWAALDRLSSPSGGSGGG